MKLKTFAFAALILTCLTCSARAQEKLERYLYVSSRDGAGGQGEKGIYVYDVDDGHKLVKFIPLPKIGGTRGMCGCAKTGKLWISHGDDKRRMAGALMDY